MRFLTPSSTTWSKISAREEKDTHCAVSLCAFFKTTYWKSFQYCDTRSTVLHVPMIRTESMITFLSDGHRRQGVCADARRLNSGTSVEHWFQGSDGAQRALARSPPPFWPLDRSLSRYWSKLYMAATQPTCSCCLVYAWKGEREL